MHLTGMHLIDMHLIDMHLAGIHLIGVHLAGVHLIPLGANFKCHKKCGPQKLQQMDIKICKILEILSLVYISYTDTKFYVIEMPRRDVISYVADKLCSLQAPIPKVLGRAPRSVYSKSAEHQNLNQHG
jgi:hypothetical protein